MTVFDNTIGGSRSELGSISGRVLRALLAALVIAVVVLGLTSGSGFGSTTALGLATMFLGALTVTAPGSTAPTLLLLLAMATHLLLDDATFDPGLAALAVLLLGIHQLSGVCAAVPGMGRVPLRALRPPALRFVASAGVALAGIAVVGLIG